MSKIVYELFWWKGAADFKEYHVVVPPIKIRKNEQLRIVVEKVDKRKSGLVDNRPMKERIFGRG